MKIDAKAPSFFQSELAMFEELKMRSEGTIVVGIKFSWLVSLFPISL